MVVAMHGSLKIYKDVQLVFRFTTINPSATVIVEKAKRKEKTPAGPSVLYFFENEFKKRF